MLNLLKLKQEKADAKASGADGDAVSAHKTLLEQHEQLRCFSNCLLAFRYQRHLAACVKVLSVLPAQ